MGELNGKVIVVTGAARGLGEAFAHACADAGAALVLNDVDAEQLEGVVAAARAAGGDAHAVVGSIDDPRTADTLVEAAVSDFGQLDGLINNAGLHDMGHVTEVDAEKATRVISVNVTGTMFCGVAAIRHMVENGGGSVLNVSSLGHLGVPKMSVYGAAKGAVASMTYAWHLDLLDTDVRVNGLCPRALTRMDHTGTQPPPADVAPIVVYLMGDASREVRGQMIRYDGTTLGLVTPPTFGDRVVERDSWSSEDIAAEFSRGQLSRKLTTPGLAGDLQPGGASYRGR